MYNSNSSEEQIYINEIIRINYKCNWKCKFCNVLMTNNYGNKDISSNEVISKILNLTKKYSNIERNNLILSFSGGEPTLNKNLISFIRLAKKVGIGTVQIQTNGTMLFKNKEYINDLIAAGLDEIFLAQHSSDIEINKKLGTFYDIDDFKLWINYIKENNINKKLGIAFNIVVNKINIDSIYDYILFLKEIGFIDLLPIEDNNGFKDTKRISFGLVQPNGYAEINKDEILLEYNDEQISKINHIVSLCKENNIYSDFHFTAPPLCVLNFKEYNLEYQRLRQIEKDSIEGKVNNGNLESYKYLWKEKQKFDECKKCINNDYCLGFYKNWLNFVGIEKVKDRINKFVGKGIKN